MFLCGDLGSHCGACASVGDFLCDFPVGDGKTCDMPLCEGHANEVAPNIHYCPGHMVLWKRFLNAGGVQRELENVVPYARPKSEV